MKEKLKYYIINNNYDFNRCIFENLTAADNKLTFSGSGSQGVGRVMTRIIDSGSKGMTWHRLLLNAGNCTPGDIKVSIYACDTDDIKYCGSLVSLDELFHRDDLSLSEKEEAFEPYLKKRVSGAADILLHDVCGRYFWLLAEIYSESAHPACINNMTVYLPSESWIDYLPQIYRKSDTDGHFLERWLAIFQTFYEEIEDRIEKTSRMFDPQCADAEYLRWLAEWLDLPNAEVWSEDKLRIMLMKAFSIYRSRGTKAALSDMIELYTGERPFIIESASLTEFAGDPLYESTLIPMYGKDPYCVTVLIKSELVKSEADLNVIKKLAEQVMPAYIELKLVLLEQYIFLGKYSYLGVNSTLGQYRQAVLDGRTQLTLSAIAAADR